MDKNANGKAVQAPERASGNDARGIVITDGGFGSRVARELPRVRAFVYGERMPAVPTLPFGRWRSAS